MPTARDRESNDRHFSAIDQTAIDLAIKRTSVVTYRQHAYEKFNISRQNELVALINNLRLEAAGAIQAA